ncbi:CPBP family intramembrane glutamic endopeptidase [Peptostreptococcus faecalis]|uniref:CPBP family intramembrane glutamic endopeptidase n=1 Tax=Peptostreptococcus faecalis TaxID=2045015 RepID=UPI000C7A2D0B|nr:CPBP family intramembrane glutamic endopeptidase [Peptostreptococcus faecalis]
MSKKYNNVVKEIFLILLILIVFDIPGKVENQVSLMIHPSNTSDSLMLTGVDTVIPIWVYLLVIGFYIFLAKKLDIAKFDLTFINKKNIIIIIGVFILDRIFDSIGGEILSLQGIVDTANQIYLEEAYSGTSWYLTFIGTSIYAPVVEEIIFRGYIVGRLFKNKPVIGITISALSFGAIHNPTDITSFMIYAMSGLLFATAYYKTKRLEVPICIHFLVNTMPF